MTMEDIFKTMQDLIAEQFAIDADEISMDSSFVDESQLWQSLDAVKEGRVLSYEQVAFMHRDPITLNAQLEIFLDFFRGFKEQA
jgi:ABC-type Fe3+-hydroxamate transport system substrate-binding protein